MRERKSREKKRNDRVSLHSCRRKEILWHKFTSISLIFEWTTSQGDLILSNDARKFDASIILSMTHRYRCAVVIVCLKLFMVESSDDQSSIPNWRVESFKNWEEFNSVTSVRSNQDAWLFSKFSLYFLKKDSTLYLIFLFQTVHFMVSQ